MSGQEKLTKQEARTLIAHLPRSCEHDLAYKNPVLYEALNKLEGIAWPKRTSP